MIVWIHTLSSNSTSIIKTRIFHTSPTPVLNVLQNAIMEKKGLNYKVWDIGKITVCHYDYNAHGVPILFIIINAGDTSLPGCIDITHNIVHISCAVLIEIHWEVYNVESNTGSQLQAWFWMQYNGLVCIL